MLYNNLRYLVADHPVTEPKTPSLCPFCNSPLYARRGNINVHHWAHFNRSPDCPANQKGETEWHYAMKLAYGIFEGWEVEYPLTVKLPHPEIDKNEFIITDKKFIIDAYNPTTHAIREIIHSLSPYYVDKHLTLKQNYKDIMWIWDGSKFGSLKTNTRRTKDGSIQYFNLLTPKPFEIFQQIGGIVHRGNMFFSHWKDNVWYPIHSKKLDILLQNYKNIIEILKGNNNAV